MKRKVLGKGHAFLMQKCRDSATANRVVERLRKDNKNPETDFFWRKEAL